ncbi:unnamed protein product, partial [Laminaria digitata]
PLSLNRIISAPATVFVMTAEEDRIRGETASGSAVDFAAIYANIKDVRGKNGRTYHEFRDSLKPSYAKAWLQIGMCYGLMIAIMVALYQTEALSWPVQVMLGIAASVFIGLGVAFLNLWIHESAHYNLHASRELND